MDTARMTDNTGCLANHHRNNAIRERTKNTVSVFVISFFPFLSPRKNIRNDMTATDSVTHDPTPAPAATWSAYTIDVKNPQINQL